MSLSKWFMYGALGVVGAVAFGEGYYYLVEFVRKRLTTNIKAGEEINELFCCRQLVNKESPLCRGIKFSPSEPSLHATQILENLILSTKRSIHLAMYIFTAWELSAAIVKAHQRGVKIFVVVDHSQANAKSNKLEDLHSAGINVRVFRAGTLHHKMCLFDVPFDKTSRKLMNIVTPHQDDVTNIKIPSNGITVTGSLNWTHSALTVHRESFIVTSHKNVCEAAGVEFYDIWDSSELLFNSNVL